MTAPAVVAMVAQGGPLDALAGQGGALAAGAVAALLAVVVNVATAVMVWRLLSALLSSPSADALKRVVLVTLAAVILLGATPGLVAGAYRWGGQIGDSVAAGGGS